ncbi:hypothetical protein C2G38_2090307, partial [Gigaspora rosea]
MIIRLFRISSIITTANRYNGLQNFANRDKFPGYDRMQNFWESSVRSQTTFTVIKIFQAEELIYCTIVITLMI